MQGGTYLTSGVRESPGRSGSVTCRLPDAALQVHDRQLNFSAIRPSNGNFDSLPRGGAIQTYTVSISNNGRDFGGSQIYTLFNGTCMTCGDEGLVQKVRVFPESFRVFRSCNAFAR